MLDVSWESSVPVSAKTRQRLHHLLQQKTCGTEKQTEDNWKKKYFWCYSVLSLLMLFRVPCFTEQYGKGEQKNQIFEIEGTYLKEGE